MLLIEDRSVTLNLFRTDTEKLRVQSWLESSNSILGEVTSYLARKNRECNVGAILYILALFNRVIEHANAINQVNCLCFYFNFYGFSVVSNSAK